MGYTSARIVYVSLDERTLGKQRKVLLIVDKRPELTRNAAKCLLCNTVIESTHRHDFVSCPCGNIAVDGGLEYTRRVGTLHDYEDLSEYE